MKNQEKTKRQQTPTSGPEVNNSPKKPSPSVPNENQQQAPQNVQDKNKKEQKLNPGVGKEHEVGDLPKKEAKNEGGDLEKRKDPDPTIPEKRNDPVAGKNDDYSRTRNTPGKKETNNVGEFTEVDELDRAEEEEEETSDLSDEEQDEDEPGSFEPEHDHKEAFGGGRKNSSAPDERKNKNGL